MVPLLPNYTLLQHNCIIALYYYVAADIALWIRLLDNGQRLSLRIT